jgi:hypothetical protein
MLAVIGGSGLCELSNLRQVHRLAVTTPYGEPSSRLTFGCLGAHELVFLARHGDEHSIAPHQINYRANIRALADQYAARQTKPWRSCSTRSNSTKPSSVPKVRLRPTTRSAICTCSKASTKLHSTIISKPISHLTKPRANRVSSKTAPDFPTMNTMPASCLPKSARPV